MVLQGLARGSSSTASGSRSISNGTKDSSSNSGTISSSSINCSSSSVTGTAKGTTPPRTDRFISNVMNFMFPSKKVLLSLYTLKNFGAKIFQFCVTFIKLPRGDNLGKVCRQKQNGLI